MQSNNQTDDESKQAHATPPGSVAGGGAGGVAMRVRRLRPDAVLPAYARAADAGMDLTACEAVTLMPGAYAAVPTGLAIALPPGTEGQVRPRSGLAARHGVTVLNAPGTIDSGYRGEVRVLLVNLGREPVTLPAGSRIAQLLVKPVLQVRITEAATLDATERGEGGFGSTGLHDVIG